MADAGARTAEVGQAGQGAPLLAADRLGQLDRAHVHLAPHAHLGYVRHKGLERARKLQATACVSPPQLCTWHGA